MSRIHQEEVVRLLGRFPSHLLVDEPREEVEGEESLVLDPLEPVPAGSLLAVPPSGPVIVIMLENKNERSILDATDAPYLQSLFDTGAVATEYQAVAHPSEPELLCVSSNWLNGVGVA